MVEPGPGEWGSRLSPWLKSRFTCTEWDIGLPERGWYWVKMKQRYYRSILEQWLSASGWKKSFNTRTMLRHEKGFPFRINILSGVWATLDSPWQILKTNANDLKKGQVWSQSWLKWLGLATDISWQRVKPLLYNVKVTRSYWTNTTKIRSLQKTRMDTVSLNRIIINVWYT